MNLIDPQMRKQTWRTKLAGEECQIQRTFLEVPSQLRIAEQIPLDGFLHKCHDEHNNFSLRSHLIQIESGPSVVIDQSDVELIDGLTDVKIHTIQIDKGTMQIDTGQTLWDLSIFTNSSSPRGSTS